MNWKYRRGQGIGAGVVLSGIITLISLAIILPMGLDIKESVIGSIDNSDWSNASNQTLATTTNNINSAFDLAAVSPLLAGAALIISMLASFAIVTRVFRSA